jgi:hypothetical protein
MGTGSTDQGDEQDDEQDDKQDDKQGTNQTAGAILPRQSRSERLSRTPRSVALATRQSCKYFTRAPERTTLALCQRSL